jgi:hypothetical protein|tara:strand:- start:2951 stop:3562 length:612 start_codon:yes stop_codon:yes gene_type:complete
MSKVLKYIIIGLLGITLANCSSNTYKIKKESKNQVLKVPSWYMKDYSENKECGTKMFGKKKDKKCVFGVGTSTSPDLELAIDKATMIAKAEVADKIKGEMNKKAKIFTTELGKSQTKTVVTDVETTIVNIIKNTPVRGYEVFKQEVTLTKNGYYRAWIGLRLPMGPYNKMYNYSMEEIVDAYQLKKLAKKSYDEVEIIATNEQ